MAIVGGPLVPLVFAGVTAATGSRFTAFLVPAARYGLITLFALGAARARVLTGMNCPVRAAH